MDRRTALEILDAVRPDSDDLHEPEVRAAAEFLIDDSDAEAIFLSRQHLDREIGQVLRDVDVPADLKHKLLTLEADRAVDRADSPEAPAPAVVLVESQPSSRRVWLRRSLAAAISAAAVLAGIGLWQSSHRDEPTVAQLERISPFDPAAPVPFRGEAPPLPFEFVGGQHRGVLTVGRARAFGPLPTAAVYDFRLPTQRRGHEVIEGALLAIPAPKVADPPPHDSLHAAPSAGYFQSSAGGYTALSWTSRNTVYVCYVKGGDDALQLLRRALMIAPA